MSVPAIFESLHATVGNWAPTQHTSLNRDWDMAPLSQKPIGDGIQRPKKKNSRQSLFASPATVSLFTAATTTSDCVLHVRESGAGPSQFGVSFRL
jgi:hypothetical protein